MTWWQRWAIPASELGPAQGPIPGMPETRPRSPVWWIGPVPWSWTSTPVDLLYPTPPVVSDLPVTDRRERDELARPEPVDGDGPPPIAGRTTPDFNIFDVQRTVRTIGTAGAVTGNPAVAGAARLLDFILGLFTPRPAAPAPPAMAPTVPTAPIPTTTPPPVPIVEDQLLLPAPSPTTRDTVQREYSPTKDYAGYETRELTGRIEDGTFRGTVETIRGTREIEVELPFPEVGF